MSMKALTTNAAARKPMARNRVYPVSSQAYGLSYEGGRPVLSLGTRKFQDVIKTQVYDTLRFKGGVAMPTSKRLKFFAVRQSVKRQIANDPSTEYVTSLIDTSLDSGFVVDKDHQLIITSVQFCILTLGNLPLSTGVDDAVQLPIEPGGATGDNNWGTATSQASLVELCQNGLYVRTKFGNSGREHEKGLLKFFPTSFGKSGSGGLASFIGTGGTADPVVINESSFTNGFGYAQQLLNPRVLESLDGVSIEIEPLLPFKVPGPFQIQCILDGFEARPV